MRISEAMREGSKGTVQGFGELEWKDYLEVTHRCAWGAAKATLRATLRGYDKEKTLLTTPELLGEEGRWAVIHHVVDCPSPSPNCPLIFLNYILLIFHLNDDHRWTREAIADFIELKEIDMEGERVIKEGLDTPEVNVELGEEELINA